MRRTAIAVAASLIMWPAGAGTADNAVHYTLTPVVRSGRLEAMTVTVQFAADPSGATEIDLPDEWGGQKDLWREIDGVTITGPHVTVEAVADPARRIVRSDPGATVTVRYNAKQDYAGEPTGGGSPYRLVVQPGYFHLIGHALFARPAGSDDRAATFAMRDLPAGWRFATTLDRRALTVGDIMASNTVGGDFRVLVPDGMDGALRIAIRGNWSFSDAAFAGDTRRVVAAEWRYWGDPPSPFTVTVLPLAGQQYISLGGTGLNAGFSFFATTNVEQSRLVQVLAHEHMHTWIPLQIGGFPDTDEAAGYWLSEGFTDYFSRRVLLASGIWRLDDYVKVMNATLYDYGTSRARNAPNADIVKSFWSDQEIEQLPYRRGNLLAMMWNAHVTGGMDAVVRNMRERARTKAAGETAPDLFPPAMKARGYDVAGDIARFVVRGDTVVLPGDLFPACGRITTERLARFERGFDAEATNAANHVIAGVDPQGAAYAAGLRNGMTLVKRTSPPVNDARIEIGYELIDNGAHRTIAWLPASRERFDVQQLHLAPGLAGDAERACIVEIAGAG